jgi:hypothetical protein
MHVALRKRNGNWHVLTTRTPANAIYRLHHAEVVVDKFIDIASVHIAGINQKDDGSRVIDMAKKCLGLLVGGAFYEGSAKDFTWIVQQHHGCVPPTPSNLDAAAQRAHRRGRPATSREFRHHVHTNRVKRSLASPHMKFITTTPALFVQASQEDRFASLPPAKQQNAITMCHSPFFSGGQEWRLGWHQQTLGSGFPHNSGDFPPAAYSVLPGEAV